MTRPLVIFLPVIYLENQSLESLSIDDVKAKFEEWNLDTYLKASTFKINGKILSYCESVEDLQEIIPMPRAIAKSLLDSIDNLKGKNLSGMNYSIDSFEGLLRFSIK